MHTRKTILAATISLFIASHAHAVSESRQEQTGTDNYADVMQQGDGNSIAQLQNGTGNVAYTDQNGVGLTANSDQTGDGNISTLEQTGSNGVITISQDGAYNLATVLQSSAEVGHSASISQVGTSNQAYIEQPDFNANSAAISQN